MSGKVVSFINMKGGVGTFEKDDIVKKIGLFSNSTSFVNDLLVGLQGNISSKYKKSREGIAVLCDEFLKKVEQYNE